MRERSRTGPRERVSTSNETSPLSFARPSFGGGHPSQRKIARFKLPAGHLTRSPPRRRARRRVDLGDVPCGGGGAGATSTAQPNIAPINRKAKLQRRREVELTEVAPTATGRRRRCAAPAFKRAGAAPSTGPDSGNGILRERADPPPTPSRQREPTSNETSPLSFARPGFGGGHPFATKHRPFQCPRKAFDPVATTSPSARAALIWAMFRVVGGCGRVEPGSVTCFLVVLLFTRTVFWRYAFP